MSRHSMPRGGADAENEPTEVPDATDAEAPQTEEPAEVAVELTDEATENADESSTETAETSDKASEPVAESAPEVAKRGTDWPRVVAYGLLPAIALLLAMAAGFLKWQSNSDRNTDIANDKSPASEAMDTAKASAISMLSYKPDTVEKQLNDARDLLTGEFRDSYTSLINDVVIPGAQQSQISAVASVPAAAVVSADPKHAVVLVFVNQTVVVGEDAPSDTASSVRVTMDKDGDRWLISEFEPV